MDEVLSKETVRDDELRSLVLTTCQADAPKSDQSVSNITASSTCIELITEKPMPTKFFENGGSSACVQIEVEKNSRNFHLKQ